MLYLVQIFSANIVCGSNIVFGPNILSKYIIYLIFSANIVFGSNIWLEVRGSEGGPFELPGLTLKNHKKRKKKRKLIFFPAKYNSANDCLNFKVNILK